MPFAMNNDQKENMYQYLLSLAQLSSWTWRVGGNGFAKMGSPGGSNNDGIQTFFPWTIAS